MEKEYKKDLSTLSTQQVVVQSFSYIQLFVTPWTAACQASLSSTISWSLLKFTSIELMMPSKHLILCYPLLLLPSIFPSIRVFSNESALRIRWPKYGTTDWFQIGKGVRQGCILSPAYSTFMQNTSCEVLDWMKHKPESRFWNTNN